MSMKYKPKKIFEMFYALNIHKKHEERNNGESAYVTSYNTRLFN